jgi:hypothetical protein
MKLISMGSVALIPKEALFDKQYAGMTTRQVFDLLKQNGGGQGGGSGHDSHDWEGAEGLSDERS